MQKLSSTKLITYLGKFLVLLLVAKVISLGVWWYLPSEGVELNAKKSYLSKYQKASFENMLKVETLKSVAQVAAVNTQSIDKFVLKGLYGTKYDGFAIIAKKASPTSTTIVEVEESFEGYVLREIELDHVIFSKDLEEYKLSLEQSEKKLDSFIAPILEDVYDDDTREKEVKREDINAYTQNPSLIWKDIGIQELKEDGRLKGFTVTRVKEGSKMAMLGLKKDDIIIKANNVAFTSLNDVFTLYKDIEKLETLALTILRNNQEKEIIYEIR